MHGTWLNSTNIQCTRVIVIKERVTCLTRAHLHGTCLSGTNLRGTCLTSGNLHGTRLSCYNMCSLMAL